MIALTGNAGQLSTAIVQAIPLPILVVDRGNAIVAANMAAEVFFSLSAAALARHTLETLVAEDTPLLGLVEQVRQGALTVSEYGLHLGTPRTPVRTVDVQVAPVPELPDRLLILIQERSIAEKMDRQLTHRGAARSVSAMAAMLAHEVKNPLSGIRGAAQLLEQSAPAADRPLTRLICDETDRICQIMDRMDVFSDARPPRRTAVNIHEVLDHVRRLAENGFARDIRIVESYDPSLPPVLGDRDQLIQVFLNLLKNAAEAVPARGGEIQVSTAFRPGVRLSLPGGRGRQGLPFEVTVQDNGPGVPEDLLPHLFDPFVTSKPRGTGLGLALVAKIIGDHGGIVEHERRDGRTLFRVLLPMLQPEE
ncbi:two-component system sensor histidine kinase NtrB [Futiania mangrovi]|uniref:histidine kinase n=1 Tax=Futiania mangrovi TaxID=2959716 RepID=A0A9J6P9Y2_9PROT|nr:ATP-binding protein [Futiania mangrovii]MCP1335781.1 ATP-binding protein [Futiania mangrovii]